MAPPSWSNDPHDEPSNSPHSVANFEQAHHVDSHVGKTVGGGMLLDPLTLPPSAAPVSNAAAAVVPKNNWAALPASQESQRTRNPIRAVVDPIMADYRKNSSNTEATPTVPSKPFISLAVRAQSKRPLLLHPFIIIFSFLFSTTSFLIIQLGDPTSSGNFEPCPIVQQVCTTSPSLSTDTAGYVNALGTDEARQVIAKYHSSWKNPLVGIPSRSIDVDHVLVASGCSGVLDLVLKALLDPGTCLLVPNPGFPLYQVIAESIGARVLPYNLLPEMDWEMDLQHIQKLIDENIGKVRAILVNNPSNPTGSVFRLPHLEDLVRLCNNNCLPIVADEIYGDLTFDETRPFVPLANVALSSSLSSSVLTESITTTASVPVIACSGIGKQFLVPGWRVGWAVFYDNHVQSLKPVEHGAKQLAQIVLGASHVAQAMATRVLSAALPMHDNDGSSPSSLQAEMIMWQRDLRDKLRSNAEVVQQSLSKAPGLVVHKALGAMYSMVTFDPSEFDFLSSSPLDTATAGEKLSTLLLQEESVFVLPGSCFGIPNAFRLVFCAPAMTLQQALDRLVAFSQRHHVGGK